MGCAVLLGAFVVFLAVAWPYYLGSWIAVEFGAHNPSTARSITGWVFEGMYVAVALLVLAAVVSARDHSAKVAAAKGELAALERSHRYQLGTAEMCHKIQKHIESAPNGTNYSGLPAGETLLFALSGVSLIEPRVAHRGEPRVPTVVDEGEILVSSKAARFHSERKQVEWRFDRILTQNEGRDRLTWAVSNRKTVSGVGGSDQIVTIVKGLRLWASELPAAPVQSAKYFADQATAAHHAAREIALQIQDKRQAVGALEGSAAPSV